MGWKIRVLLALFQPWLKKECEHVHRLYFSTSVNFLMEICVLHPGWNWAFNRNNISTWWVERNFSPGWNSRSNQALRGCLFPLASSLRSRREERIGEGAPSPLFPIPPPRVGYAGYQRLSVNTIKWKYFPSSWPNQGTSNFSWIKLTSNRAQLALFDRVPLLGGQRFVCIVTFMGVVYMLITHNVFW